jgi:hypothetical protein
MVTERPVEERVPLREEHVRIECRPVDKPVGTHAANKPVASPLRRLASQQFILDGWREQWLTTARR